MKIVSIKQAVNNLIRNLWNLWGFVKTNIRCKLVKKELFNLIVQYFLGIVIAATLPIFSLLYNSINTDIQLVNHINNIRIGSNKEYMDQIFGLPIFEHAKNQLVEDVYDAKYVYIRAYYDNNELIGYFVTQYKKGFLVEICLPKSYRRFVDGKPIGKFTFEDVTYPCGDVKFIDPNGNVITTYVESCFTNSSGHYNCVEFAYFYYGLYDNLKDFEHYDGVYHDDTAEHYNPYIQPTFSFSRSSTYPNSYGIIKGGTGDYYDKVMDFIIATPAFELDPNFDPIN